MSEPLLTVSNLSVDFHTARGVVHAVKNVSWSVNRGETLAILGESGSGKSVSANAVMRTQCGRSLSCTLFLPLPRTFVVSNSLPCQSSRTRAAWNARSNAARGYSNHPTRRRRVLTSTIRDLAAFLHFYSI